MADFMEGCPYFRPDSLNQSARINRPMFRFQERFSECVSVLLIVLSKFADHESSGSIYTGDSSGGRSYIDTSMIRACPKQCRCRCLRSNSFAFEVQKTAHDINVRLYSLVLKVYLPLLLGQERDPRCTFPVFIGGFHLLENIDTLEHRLQELRAEMLGSSLSHSFFRTLILSREESTQFEAELSLLVEGLVADYQVFESFGYEKLYEKGFLTYDRWKSFQSSKTCRSLDQLDRATHTIDQLEGHEDPNGMGGDDLPEFLQGFHSMPSVPSPGITRPQYEIVGPVNDGSSPLIAAIYTGRNDVIAELLAHRMNPMILSKIKQEDQWLVAQSLLDHGVNATSLFKSTHGFEHMEPRLLYVLMEKGADIYSSWPTSTQWFLTHGPHASDHDIQEAKAMRAHNLQLLGAIRRGDLRWAEDQINLGADPTFGIDSALVGEKWEILRLLLQKGADPRVLEFGKPKVYLQEDVIKDACLLTVAEEGLTAVVKSLLHLRGCNKMVAEDLRRPSLKKLIQWNRTPILRMLLFKGIFSRDYLASSSEWSLPIAAETSMPLFDLLLSFGACASTALIAAVADRNLTSVILLLKGIKEHPMPNNINALRVHGGRTLLMEAVHNGSVEIAQRLIDNGANPYTGTWCGGSKHDSFTIAAENGFKGLSQMLRRAATGRRPVTYMWNLKSLDDFVEKEGLDEEKPWPSRYDFIRVNWVEDSQVSRKTANTAITLRQGSRRPGPPTVQEDCLNTIKIRCLHREFRRQHTHIFKCARASTNLVCSPPREGSHCPAWGDVFDYNHSKAWSRGIAVMRGLCRGEAPSTLYDVIMFLALGKAICLSKIASSLSDHHAEFLADLGRWQVLFRSDKWSLSAFRSAVSDIWHVSAEELDRNHPPYSTSLVHFQELAMSLITNVEQSFDNQIDLDYGLLASQERWSWNRLPEISETQRPEPFDMQFPENTVERGKSNKSDTPSSTPSGETNVSQSPETQIPLRDAIHNDSRLRTCNTIVVLLMAGFVFSVVLVFLKGTSLEPNLIKFTARLILGALRAATRPATADPVNINCV